MSNLTGIVVSDAMINGCVVEIKRMVMHSKYKKRIKKTSRISADNPGNLAKSGDEVVIISCRPISKTKSWRVIKIKSKNDIGDLE